VSNILGKKLKMESFYKAWLRKSDEENLEALRPIVATSSQSIPNTSQNLLLPEPSQSIPSTSQNLLLPEPRQSIPSSSQNVLLPPEEDTEREQSTLPSQTISDKTQNEKYKTQTDIIYENEKLIMIVQRGTFQRQKRFRLQDHLFHIKIKMKQEDEPIPFLKDLLDFIQEGLLHVMENIKKFYNEEDTNLAFLTLFQKPMITGLNSGIFIFWPLLYITL
jgi:hypothetical protein